jgi:tRNA A37 threonylcarbamoyltransferase TsaD
LTRGVGLHTILGMTIDSAAGEIFDKAATIIKKYEKVLNDEDNQNEFIDKYNKKAGSEVIPKDYFKSFLSNDKISRGRYIEMLAKYGNPTEIELPMGLKSD